MLEALVLGKSCHVISFLSPQLPVGDVYGLQQLRLYRGKNEKSIRDWGEDKDSEKIKRSLMSKRPANPLWCFQLSPVTSGSRIAVGDDVLFRC